MRRNGWFLGGTLSGLALVSLVECATAAEVLDSRALGAEMGKNEALRLHVDHAGRPDLAQRLPVHSDLPWDNYIVRLIYLDSRTEIAFSRAYLLGRPEIGLLRYRRPLTEELAAQTRDYLATAEPAPSAYVPSSAAVAGDEGLGPAERAEAAAQRAEAAAEMTERGAMAAEQAVAQLESAAARAEEAFKKTLRK
jgi:hypothetical protein